MHTALIVEDEPEANKLLSRLVQLRGYRTDSAFTGGEALEKIRQHAPDIVFLDLMLPDIDGFKVCQAVKAERSTSMVSVVMVTARIAAENRCQGFKAGADDYIPKPYTPDQIFHAMAEADAWKRSVDEGDLQGSFDVTLDEEDEFCRDLSRLRSLLLGRSPLSPESIDRISTALRAFRTEAIHWGANCGSPRLATIDYRLEPDRLLVTLGDVAGWSGPGKSSGSEGIRSCMTFPHVFDSVENLTDPPGLRLVKSFSPTP